MIFDKTVALASTSRHDLHALVKSYLRTRAAHTGQGYTVRPDPVDKARKVRSYGRMRDRQTSRRPDTIHSQEGLPVRTVQWFLAIHKNSCHVNAALNFSPDGPHAIQPSFPRFDGEGAGRAGTIRPARKRFLRAAGIVSSTALFHPD